jgi:serine/threonine protein kinase
VAGADDVVARKRLVREAQAMARVTHANVVTVYDAGAIENEVWIAMEHVEGGTLRTWASERARSVREIVAQFLLAGRGLAAAHEVGLVHRDFKPENVLVGRDGRVRVADFGLAFETAATQAPSGSSTTRTTSFAGTPAYMSPEQHLGRVADARSDQFSFCVALWEAIYGALPFAGEGHALTAAVISGRIEPPVRRAPRWLQQALRRGLDVNPEKRWPDLAALLAVLVERPRRRRRLIAIASACVIVGIASAGFSLLRNEEPMERSAPHP